ncbi:hypothetical protein O181_130633 [Austropuccinia psidii MF-1]|uniref:Uncharacterized protein n=1 Tax=Austropuccinia psidii MF-1 TaxID=1389203 RepID=A0A9Q3L0E6_9BASI|nr:hypothetical protein [Austropuccinia psidii MF-1]
MSNQKSFVSPLSRQGFGILNSNQDDEVQQNINLQPSSFPYHHQNIQENFPQYNIYDHLNQFHHLVSPYMQHSVNNSDIYPHHNIYRQCNIPLHEMEHELNHVISAMPDNESQERNERDKHQVIASSNNLLHLREEFDLPVRSQTSQTQESKLSKQTSATLKNEKQKRK